MFFKLIRPCLFLFNPETAHQIAKKSFIILSALRFLSFFLGNKVTRQTSLQRHCMGLNFKNPVGVAAGFDKNGEMIKPLAELGFGFIEVGTVTPLPQQGNPKPRCFRVTKDKAIINRMGFNNQGAEYLLQKLKKRPSNLIVGVNIGKNTLTVNENAHHDYLLLLQKLYDHADYFVINVSCPNIKNLEDLQHKESLEIILKTCVDFRRQQPTYKPLLLKISPDLDRMMLDQTIDSVKTFHIDGVIACNTTTQRTNLLESPEKIKTIGNGGLSGKPLTQRTLEAVRYIKSISENKFHIIAVGGIMTSQDGKNLLNAGADLLQLYTGFIYQGPSLLHQICKKIKHRITLS